MNLFAQLAKAIGGQPSSRLPASANGRLKVTNRTRGTVLATQLEVADSAPKRSKGLLGRDGLAYGEGLWITPCESVHTFFMRFPIDLVYLDRKFQVKKVKSAVVPWRMSACFLAHSILELPAGTVRISKTQRGDTLDLSPASSRDSKQSIQS